jgi:hypothetical protein
MLRIAAAVCKTCSHTFSLFCACRIFPDSAEQLTRRCVSPSGALAQLPQAQTLVDGRTNDALHTLMMGLIRTAAAPRLMRPLRSVVSSGSRPVCHSNCAIHATRLLNGSQRTQRYPYNLLRKLSQALHKHIHVKSYGTMCGGGRRSISQG